MSEQHKCDLEIIIGHSGYFYARCIIKGCDVELTSAQIVGRLNEHAALKREFVEHLMVQHIGDMGMSREQAEEQVALITAEVG